MGSLLIPNIDSYVRITALARIATAQNLLAVQSTLCIPLPAFHTPVTLPSNPSSSTVPLISSLIKLRNLLQKRDGTGMTFLMHAARGYPEGTADQLQKEQVKKIEKNNLWKKNQPKLKLPEAGSPKNLATDTPSTARRASAPAGLRSIPKSEGTVEGDGLQSRKPTTVVWGDFPGTVLTEAYQNNPGNEDGPQQGNTPASESLKERDEDDGMKDLATENYPSAQENELVVFKVAWALVKETLWKEQVCIGLETEAKQARKTMTINCVEEVDCSPWTVDTRYIPASS